MSKQPKKPTLADKQNAKAAAETKANPKAKVKGPTPDFEPNHARTLARQLQAQDLAEKARAEHQEARIQEEMKRLSNLVKGVPGTYHVFGRCSDGGFTTHTFCVQPHWFPANGDKPGQDVMVIQESLLRNNEHEGIFILHSWLIRNSAKVHCARGKIGDIQVGMLRFLQNALKVQIAEQIAEKKVEHALKTPPTDSGNHLAANDSQAFVDDTGMPAEPRELAMMA